MKPSHNISHTWFVRIALADDLRPWQVMRFDATCKKLNKDPWGNEYQYQLPGANGEFDIYSFGADSAVGGADEAADIGNWNLDS